MYDLLSNEPDGLAITEMVENGVWLQNKKDEQYQLEMLEELVYRKNERLIYEGKRYRIEPLPMNDLRKIIVSVSQDHAAKERATDFHPMELPFFNDPLSIERLVTSKTAASFCVAHFEPSRSAPHGHRRADSFIQGQNLIAFDIDAGITLDEAIERLHGYVYLIYTTKSHRKEKNGEIADRFRILLPTKTKFFVTVEQHKKLYENIADLMGFPTYDASTRNVSRLWYTNPEAEIFKEEKGELLDVRCCIPRTEQEERILPKLKDLDQLPNEDELDKRTNGMIKFTVMNGIAGQRNYMIMRLVRFLKDIGHPDITSVTYQTNAMLAEPLHEAEVEDILRKQGV